MTSSSYLYPTIIGTWSKVACYKQSVTISQKDKESAINVFKVHNTMLWIAFAHLLSGASDVFYRIVEYCWGMMQS